MSFFDELGLRAANELEQNLGPFLALPSYKRLLPAPPAIRIQAALGALRCAMALADAKEFSSLLSTWTTIPTGAPFAPLIELAIERVRARRPEDAVRLAEAEHARHPSSRVAYLVARLHHDAGDPRPEAWETALFLAERDKDRPTKARVVAALCRSQAKGAVRQRERLLALVDDVKDDVSEPIDLLAIAAVRLTSSSRFQRASALSTLETLARTSAERRAPNIEGAAIRLTARHVDRSGARMDPIEIDRARSVLRLIQDEARREAVLARLELIERTRATNTEGVRATLQRCDPRLQGAFERANALATGAVAPRSPDDEVFLLHTLALDLVEASTSSEAANRILSRLSELSDRGARLPSSLWAGIRLALASADRETQRLATTLAGSALSAGVPLPRRHGYVELGLLLQRAGREDLALVAFEFAIQHREPEGLRLFASMRQREAYAAIAAGDRKKGLALLRDAKQLFNESTIPPPR